MDYTKLSKTVSYILRHEPEKYGLQLENEGWVEIECLCRAVEQDDFKKVTKFDLITMIEKSKKRRHEIVDSKIRATYGHSVNSKINYEKSIPPEFLYHGTARRFIENILKEGLISRDRQYVHLSSDLETAISVGKRYDDKPNLKIYLMPLQIKM